MLLLNHFLLVIFIFVQFISDDFSAHANIVRVQQGKLEGTEDVSRGGIKYFSFRGVPYAKPPVGSLRFQNPQNPESWTGIRKAKKFSHNCPQFGWDVNDGIHGNEDCLYLNVFTSQVNNQANTTLMPVLFWIHGGSFITGTGSLYGPDYFMDQPIVLVTINYRLGALGFLHFDDDELPGNYGIKDQVVALQWVQQNIRVFGGDPSQVTIGGQSSGGSCVHWHMLSNISKGLFHRAISQSGSALNTWAEVPKRIAKDRGLMIARLVGCNYESVQENVKCLKQVPVYELIKAQSKFSIWSYHPMSLAIVPENASGSAWRMQTLDANVPWLIGFTSHEGEGEISNLLLDDARSLKNLQNEYQTLLPIVFMYNIFPQIRSVDEMNRLTEKVRQFYFKNETIHEGTLKQLGNLWSDSLAIYGVTEAAKRHIGKTYFYVFSHLPEHSYTELDNKNYKPNGPVHCDDLTTLFNTTYFPKPLNSADRHVSDLMIKMWTNFIISGNPNNADLGFQWAPLSGPDINFLQITKNPEMKPYYWKDGFSFWQNFNS